MGEAYIIEDKKTEMDVLILKDKKIMDSFEKMINEEKSQRLLAYENLLNNLKGFEEAIKVVINFHKNLEGNSTSDVKENDK